MSIRPIALAGAALIALTAGINVAYADEQDDEVRALNNQQLEKAQSGDTAPMTAPEPAADEDQDGQGGPEFQGPPTPDEGMSDDEDSADQPGTDDDDAATDDEVVPQGPDDDEYPAEPK